MGIETKYDYIYYTVIRRGDMGWCDDVGFTWEKAIDFINHKLKESDDISVNKYRVEYAGYEQDIDAWIRTHERHKERPVFVQFQDDQPIMIRGEGSMFVLYEIGYGEEQEDDNMFTNEYNNIHSPDINEGSVDGLAGAGGRL